MSIIEAHEKGYNLTLKEDSNKVINMQNNKKEIYIKDEKIRYKYVYKDKTKYLLKPEDKYLCNEKSVWLNHSFLL